MILERFPEIQALPDDEKLRLASELMEIATICEGENQELDKLLDARWREFQDRPDAVIPWSEVEARLRPKRA